jgi:hypothetical protein
MMRLARPIFLTVLAVAIAAYAFDCGAAATPEQAMQCCNSMPCSSHDHDGQDCCKTMSTVRVPFVQPSSLHGVSYSPLVFAMLPAVSESHLIDSVDRVVVEQSHAPPILGTLAPLSLRL